MTFELNTFSAAYAVILGAERLEMLSTVEQEVVAATGWHRRIARSFCQFVYQVWAGREFCKHESVLWWARVRVGREDAGGLAARPGDSEAVQAADNAATALAASMRALLTPTELRAAMGLGAMQ